MVKSLCIMTMNVSSQQTSLTRDTEGALTNIKGIEDVVREDHQSLVTHVCEHIYKLCYSCHRHHAFVNFKSYKCELVCFFPPLLFSTVR